MNEIPEHMRCNYRVFVVDDESHIRTTVMALLEKHGYTVLSFDKGCDALESFNHISCDLVLSDVKMPGMDGLELISRIRAFDPDIPVILMTAYANLDTTVSALKSGAFDFIVKPFDSDSLILAVDKGVRYRRLCQLEKEYTAQLEADVAKKTNELQKLHSKVILSEKMAAIGLLSAGIAHEINTPVCFISSNLSSMSKYIERMTDFIAWQKNIIETYCSPEIIREQTERKNSAKIDRGMKDMQVIVDDSQQGIERIKQIIGGLKNFARKDESSIVEADLNDLVKNTLTIVWNEIKYVASLNKELGDIPLVRCHPSQINQVIVNLLINAAHAIDSKHGTISIRTWSDEYSVFLEVGDTGYGIPPENISKIFDAFFTTKAVGKGTGLGLSISADIIHQHGGEITVNSQVGVGTTFTVRLPIMGKGTMNQEQTV